MSEREGLKPYFQSSEEGKPDGDAYRLPTEAEWECACRARTTTRYNFGDDAKSLDDYVWFGDNSERKTHPVGQMKPNGWGLFDMHGNVWEWCGDGYDKDYYRKSPGSDPFDGESALRVIRGGSWVIHGKGCRSANREGLAPESLMYSLGFRVARRPSSL